MHALWIFIIAFIISTVQRGFALECYCEAGGCADYHVNNTCRGANNAKCYAAVREEVHEKTGEAIIVHDYGCLPGDENTILQCKGNLVPQHHYRFRIVCCDDGDFCNQELEPELPLRTTTPSYDPSPHSGFNIDWRYVGTALGVLLLVASGIFITLCVRKCQGTDMKKVNLLENQALMFKSKLQGSLDLEKGACMDQSMTSGSGRGNPRLVQQTVYKQLDFKEPVGKGRYGEVVHARYRDDDVAVKIFSTLDEASWQSERDLYQTCMLRHENILGFIAADVGGRGAFTELILVMEYQKASLYDYLRGLSEPLAIPLLFKMAHSIASGLAFLHADIVGTSCKPVIAHRDIKSKNILVKHDGVTCVIADLGLAVRKDRSENLILDSDKRQGTRRYMAPEILDFTIRTHDFESFLKADMYSFSLVLWELARCSDSSGIGKEYRLPYQDEVGDDPDFAIMYLNVCDLKRRPLMAPHWKENEPMNTLVKLIEECWNADPSARLTALNVKKKLGKNF